MYLTFSKKSSGDLLFNAAIWITVLQLVLFSIKTYIGKWVLGEVSCEVLSHIYSELFLMSGHYTHTLL